MKELSAYTNLYNTELSNSVVSSWLINLNINNYGGILSRQHKPFHNFAGGKLGTWFNQLFGVIEI
jgi:hypothetical protein